MRIRSLKNQNGFTLIELIVVIAILGVLAAIAVPTVNNYLGSSKERSWNAEQGRIQTAVDAYMSNPANKRAQGKPQVPDHRQRPDQPGPPERNDNSQRDRRPEPVQRNEH